MSIHQGKRKERSGSKKRRNKNLTCEFPHNFLKTMANGASTSKASVQAYNSFVQTGKKDRKRKNQSQMAMSPPQDMKEQFYMTQPLSPLEQNPEITTYCIQSTLPSSKAQVMQTFHTNPQNNIFSPKNYHSKKSERRKKKSQHFKNYNLLSSSHYKSLHSPHRSK